MAGLSSRSWQLGPQRASCPGSCQPIESKIKSTRKLPPLKPCAAQDWHTPQTPGFPLSPPRRKPSGRPLWFTCGRSICRGGPRSLSTETAPAAFRSMYRFFHPAWQTHPPHSAYKSAFPSLLHQHIPNSQCTSGSSLAFGMFRPSSSQGPAFGMLQLQATQILE